MVRPYCRVGQPARDQPTGAYLSRSVKVAPIDEHAEQPYPYQVPSNEPLPPLSRIDLQASAAGAKHFGAERRTVTKKLEAGKENPDPLAAWAKTVHALLKASFDVSSKTSDHGPTLGSAREAFVIEMLRRFLPESLHVGRGKAVSRRNQRSRQLDVVVYRNDMPMLTSFTEASLYFIEGVLATMEVKSRLDARSLSNALTNCLSVKRLFSNDRGESGIKLSQEVPATYVFGYQRLTCDTCRRSLHRWMNEENPSEIYELPDIVVADGLVVVKNDGAVLSHNLFEEKGDSRPLFLAKPDENPMRWMLLHLLQKIWRGNQRRPVHDMLLGRVAEDCRQLVAEAEQWGKWDRSSGEIVNRIGE